MAVTNESENRTFVYQDSFYQIKNGATTDTLEFIQDWEFTPSMDDFDIDHIDTGKPIFTKKSDIVGTFEFTTKNTVDVYDSTGSSNLLKATSWMEGIAKGEPVTITFITILTAPKDGGAVNGFVTYEFTGRIMTTPVIQTRDTGVQELLVTGEITDIVKVDLTSKI